MRPLVAEEDGRRLSWFLLVVIDDVFCVESKHLTIQELAIFQGRITLVTISAYLVSRGVHSPKPIMHSAYPPCFYNIYKFVPPYFRQVYTCPDNSAKFTCFLKFTFSWLPLSWP